MRLFKKNARDKETMFLQGEVGTATRAVYQGRKELPKVEIKIRVQHGHHKGEKKDFDEVVVEMDAVDANDFARDLLAVLHSALPQVARGPIRTAHE